MNPSNNPYRRGRSIPNLPRPSPTCNFRLGFSEEANKRMRTHMEDAHCFFYDFMNVPNQGFFAVFDGHGGVLAAEWCGENFHRVRGPALLTIYCRCSQST